MTTPHSRWSFSLRALLIVVILLAIPLGWVGWNLRIVHERELVRAWIEVHGGHIKTYRGVCDFQGDYEPLPLLRQILGDRPAREIWISKDTTAKELDMVIRAFPEASLPVQEL